LANKKCAAKNEDSLTAWECQDWFRKNLEIFFDRRNRFVNYDLGRVACLDRSCLEAIRNEAGVEPGSGVAASSREGIHAVAEAVGGGAELGCCRRHSKDYSGGPIQARP
jgi:hypothetical protein